MIEILTKCGQLQRDCLVATVLIVGVDNWYIDQDDLDAILDNDSQHDTGGYLDQYGFRALQNQRENDK